MLEQKAVKTLQEPWLQVVFTALRSPPSYYWWINWCLLEKSTDEEDKIKTISLMRVKYEDFNFN